MSAGETIVVAAPDLGASDPMRVSAWLVEVGETVRAGDRLVELLVPGVTYDIASPGTGRLAEIFAQTGVGVRAGDPLGVIEIDEDV